MDKVDRDIETLPEFAWLRAENSKMWYQAHEVAEGLGLSTSTVRRYCEAGKFPGARLYADGGWRIPHSGIKAYLRDQTIEKSSQEAQ